MINRVFYAFCRDQSKIELDEHRKKALIAVYKYMWECGTTKTGVAQFIEYCIYQTKEQALICAYQWVGDIFTGNVAASSIEKE